MTLTVEPDQQIVVPCLRSAIRHAVPNVVHGKVVPTLMFLVLLEFVGTVVALLAALGWSLGLVALRRRADRRVPGLVVVGVVTLTGRTVAALLTGSMIVYFAQPTITTVAHPLMERFFVRLSLLWSATSILNAGVTVWMLLSRSTTTFVVVKSVLGPITAVVTIGIMLWWLRRQVARTDVTVVWSGRAPACHRVESVVPAAD